MTEPSTQPSEDEVLNIYYRHHNSSFQFPGEGPALKLQLQPPQTWVLFGSWCIIGFQV